MMIQESLGLNHKCTINKGHVYYDSTPLLLTLNTEVTWHSAAFAEKKKKSNSTLSHITIVNIKLCLT